MQFRAAVYYIVRVKSDSPASVSYKQLSIIVTMTVLWVPGGSQKCFHCVVATIGCKS